VSRPEAVPGRPSARPGPGYRRDPRSSPPVRTVSPGPADRRCRGEVGGVVPDDRRRRAAGQGAGGTAPGGSGTVTVAADHDQATVSVTDTGAGSPSRTGTGSSNASTARRTSHAAPPPAQGTAAASSAHPAESSITSSAVRHPVTLRPGRSAGPGRRMNRMASPPAGTVECGPRTATGPPARWPVARLASAGPAVFARRAPAGARRCRAGRRQPAGDRPQHPDR
jgi:hypothetical protein